MAPDGKGDGQGEVIPVPVVPKVEAGPAVPVAPVVPVAPDAPVPGKEAIPVTPGSAALVDLSGKQGEAILANPSVPEAGRVHQEFIKKIGEVTTADKDLEALTGKPQEDGTVYTIEDIRYKTRLLKKEAAGEKPEEQVNNLKEETARRMKAYTTDAGNGWFQLDYAKLGSDKNGLTHELHVGLGDVLLDLDIEKIAVEKNGQIITAHRGIVESGPYAGRVGFLDDKNSNEYVATHTGDKFRILSNENMAVPAYVGKLTEENGKREAGRASFNTGTMALYLAEKDVTMKPGIDLKDTYTDREGKAVTVGVTNDIIEKAAAECKKPSEAGDAVERENLMRVLNYIAYKVGVPAYGILAVIKHEGGVTFPVTGGNQDGGLARGMGQMHPEAWATVKADRRFSELVGSVMVENPGDAGRNKNIFVDLVGVAVLMKKGFETFKFDVNYNTPPAYLLEEKVSSPDGVEMTRMAWTRMYYHVSSYASQYAKAIRLKSMDDVSEKAKVWMQKHVSDYMDLSATAVAAKQAMVAKGMEVA
ncbi:MAG: hypothetical protein WCX95_04860 [Candidatus Gracilibacteria bacterium]